MEEMFTTVIALIVGRRMYGALSALIGPVPKFAAQAALRRSQKDIDQQPGRAPQKRPMGSSHMLPESAKIPISPDPDIGYIEDRGL